MNQKTRTPTPDQLRAQETQDLQARMSQPIDVQADYKIPGASIQALLQAIDETPTKHGRLLVPLLLGSVERIDGRAEED